MIAVIQRVSRAGVSVEGTVIGSINTGLVILLGVMDTDRDTDGKFLAEKIAHFRIFNDDQGKMNRSILDVKGSALVVSQFTLCGDWRKGRRPSFVHAATPELGKTLYQVFMDELRSQGVPVQQGQFGAMMDVELINDGPVTFVLDSQKA
ncbi:MAG: D-tyrosyl-tRNA(Tyr) deacylase [FCB group bacterium]|nr:D-tyrosyl-tRNA(Tyr) deacylase [FCB group bacterium]